MKLVGQLRRRLETIATRGGFAAVLLSTYFAPTGSLSLCNAGHPPPLFRRAESPHWIMMKQASRNQLPASAPLGVVDRNDYQEFTTKLQAGDVLLHYSGVWPECRDSRGMTIGTTGFLDRVHDLNWQDPADCLDRLARQLRADYAGNLSDSDATLLLCRATSQPIGWWNNLLAPFRLLRPVTDKTRIE